MSSDLEDDGSEAENLSAITSRDWQQLTQRRYKDGLREGTGEEDGDRLQDGFSHGFHLAYRGLWELSTLRGQLCALQLLDPDAIETDTNEQYLKQLAAVEQAVISQLKNYQTGNTSENTLLSNLNASTGTCKTLDEFIQTVKTYLGTKMG